MSVCCSNCLNFTISEFAILIFQEIIILPQTKLLESTLLETRSFQETQAMSAGSSSWAPTKKLSGVMLERRICQTSIEIQERAKLVSSSKKRSC